MEKSCVAWFLRRYVGICMEEQKKPQKVEVKWHSYSVPLSELTEHIVSV